jgi:hypothetical protein
VNNKEKTQFIDTQLKEMGFVLTTLRYEELISANTFDLLHNKAKAIGGNLPSLLDIVNEVWENGEKASRLLSSSAQMQHYRSLEIADFTIEIRKRNQ